MIAIADYGVGNIFSLYRSFEAIGADARLTDDPAVLRRAVIAIFFIILSSKICIVLQVETLQY